MNLSYDVSGNESTQDLGRWANPVIANVFMVLNSFDSIFIVDDWGIQVGFWSRRVAL